MRARCPATHLVAKSDKGNPSPAQVYHQCPTLLAIGTDSNVHCILVIESHPVMSGRLPHSAHWQRAVKVFQKKLCDLPRVGQ